jgi:hypothetical protein
VLDEALSNLEDDIMTLISTSVPQARENPIGPGICPVCGNEIKNVKEKITLYSALEDRSETRHGSLVTVRTNYSDIQEHPFEICETCSGDIAIGFMAKGCLGTLAIIVLAVGALITYPPHWIEVLFVLLVLATLGSFIKYRKSAKGAAKRAVREFRQQMSPMKPAVVWDETEFQQIVKSHNPFASVLDDMNR